MNLEILSFWRTAITSRSLGAFLNMRSTNLDPHLETKHPSLNKIGWHKPSSMLSRQSWTRFGVVMCPSHHRPSWRSAVLLRIRTTLERAAAAWRWRHPPLDLEESGAFRKPSILIYNLNQPASALLFFDASLISWLILAVYSWTLVTWDGEPICLEVNPERSKNQLQKMKPAQILLCMIFQILLSMIFGKYLF